jgi:hypothetical protein
MRCGWTPAVGQCKYRIRPCCRCCRKHLRWLTSWERISVLTSWRTNLVSCNWRSNWTLVSRYRGNWRTVRWEYGWQLVALDLRLHSRHALLRVIVAYILSYVDFVSLPPSNPNDQVLRRLHQASRHPQHLQLCENHHDIH